MSGAGTEIRVLPYPIVVEHDSLDRLGGLVARYAPAHRYAIITDSNVGPIYGKRAAAGLPASAELIAVPAGEIHKTRETWSLLTDELLSRGFGRDTTIIALGGGVVGDLGGFVAATFMRGIPIVQVPTTLLAMIDASIGGKTGVDTPRGKNLVGAFHQPSVVVVDPQTLGTLAVSNLRTGLAEAIKHGAVADSGYFESVTRELPVLLASDGRSVSDSFSRVIVRSIEIKAEVVLRDERERGLRKVLNFGHTVGHALEALSGYELAHGEAVAIGMALESAMAERSGIAEAGTAERIRDSLRAAGLPVDRPPAISGQRTMEAMKSDKKARGGKVEFALPSRIGAMAGADSGWTVTVAEDIILEVLH